MSVRAYGVRQNALYYASVALVFFFMGLSFTHGFLIPGTSNAFFTLLIILAIRGPYNISRAPSVHTSKTRVFDWALFLFIIDVLVTCTNTMAGRALTRFWHSRLGFCVFAIAVSLAAIYVGNYAYQRVKEKQLATASKV